MSAEDRRHRREVLQEQGCLVLGELLNCQVVNSKRLTRTIEVNIYLKFHLILKVHPWMMIVLRMPHIVESDNISDNIIVCSDLTHQVTLKYFHNSVENCERIQGDSLLQVTLSHPVLWSLLLVSEN